MPLSMMMYSQHQYSVYGRVLRNALKAGNGRYLFRRFENGEAQLVLQDAPRKKTCLMIGSISPPDGQLLEMLLLADTLRAEGAPTITAIFPYLAYARHDRAERGVGLTTCFVGRLLKDSGVNRILSLEVHSEADRTLYPIPLHSIPAAPLIAPWALRLTKKQEITIISPDQGSIARCAALAAELAIKRPVPYVKKIRTSRGVSHRGFIGKVTTSHAIIFDDMLDTGATLVQCCRLLKKQGVAHIIVCVIHGIFTGDVWQELWKLGVDRIVCTDTIVQRATVKNDPRITVLPAASYFARQCQRYV